MHTHSFLSKMVAFSGIIALVWTSGCGPKPASLPGEPIGGKMTIRGKAPGAPLNIDFVLESDKTQKGSGSVDADGTFRGRAPVGKLKVSIKNRTPPMNGPQLPNQVAAPPVGSIELSPNAMDPNKSGVEIEVPVGGSTTLQLDFTK